MIVYVDVLIVLNFIVNYLLLTVSAHLCGASVRRIRVILAALVGAGSALVIFLPPWPGALNVAFKLALTAVLTILAGGVPSIRHFLKRYLMLLVASFLFGGFTLFVTLLSGGKSGFYLNGACYFNVSAFNLLACSGIAYGVLLASGKLFKKSLVGEEVYDVFITAGGITCKVPGVMDSQNRLIDLFSGTPVVIGPPTLLRSVLPPGLESALSGGGSYPQGVRLIPCSTVAGQDVLPAFRPERMVLDCGGEQTLVEDVYIAVAASLDSTGMRKLILNPALSGRKLQKQN